MTEIAQGFESEPAHSVTILVKAAKGKISLR